MYFHVYIIDYRCNTYITHIVHILTSSHALISLQHEERLNSYQKLVCPLLEPQNYFSPYKLSPYLKCRVRNNKIGVNIFFLFFEIVSPRNLYTQASLNRIHM
jgi:hypothetical protein